MTDPGPDDTDVSSGGTDDGGTDDGGTDDEDTLRDTARQAVQVAVASTLAIVVGTQLSSTRWFWAVITAFIVYTGTSTRGDILSKGWQRVLGTVAGVGAGVVVAALVGGNTRLAVVLIVVCVFLAVYLMSVSPAIMMFFITTALALLYGLLGQFSLGLLLVRLDETAAGAAIGVLVSYVVLPVSTSEAARVKVRAFLLELADLIAWSGVGLTGSTEAAAPPARGRARRLRDSFDSLRTTARPLTHGLAGVVSTRSGTRRTMQVLAACDHHGRALARTVDAATGAAEDPVVRRAVERAVEAVRANVETFATATGAELSDASFETAATRLEEVERVVTSTPGLDRRRLMSAVRHLHAIDQAVCARAEELGAAVSSATSTGRPPGR